MMNTCTRKSVNRGFSLIEVLIGILIFALGMMALASLQTSLARNSGDANARTVAINIAEEFIESARRFQQVGASTDPLVSTFDDIATGTETATVGQIEYTVNTVVTPYYYNYATGTFSENNTDSAAYPDMKLVSVTVDWNPGQEFQVDQTPGSATDLGTGSITLTDVISSIASPAGGRVILAAQDSSGYAPPVDYSPGMNPDIISIEIGHEKFKESTTPLPKVIRQDELVETRFDVVTYSQNNAGSTFLRREEFRAVSCECILRLPSEDGDGGFRPTVWEGDQYSDAEWISKPYGESANNQQSTFCDMCCRDHHDGGSPESDVAADPGGSKYQPFRTAADFYEGGGLDGDHKHYNRNRQGEFTLATMDGDIYLEACRLVRKDGFFRVGQDMRQEGFNAFPADFLDDSGEIDQYSDYVTWAVSEFEEGTHADPPPAAPTNPYESTPPILKQPGEMPTPVAFPGTEELATTLPTPSGSIQQQLRARGIYIDYMNDALREKIICLETDGNTGATCGVPDVTTALEIIPFYDVQLTWLARWNETPTNIPVDVTNETIADNNTHNRGVARMMAPYGQSEVNPRVHIGNLGLTGTDPIDELYTAEEEDYILYVDLDLYEGPPALSGIIISGDIISSVNGLRADLFEIEATGAQCDRTNTGFECNLEIGANNPRIKIFNYFKRNKILLACSEVLAVHGTEHVSSGTSAADNWTRFGLPSEATLDAHIVVKEDNCN